MSIATVQIQQKEEYKMEFKSMGVKTVERGFETARELQNTLISGMTLYFINKQ